jgi:hypothetical protein
MFVIVMNVLAELLDDEPDVLLDALFAAELAVVDPVLVDTPLPDTV